MTDALSVRRERGRAQLPRFGCVGRRNHMASPMIQPPHARRVRHRDELLPVAAPVHEVLVPPEEGVTGAAKVYVAQAHHGCRRSAARAWVRGAGEACRHSRIRGKNYKANASSVQRGDE